MGKSTKVDDEVTCQLVMVIEDASEFLFINESVIFHKALGVLTLVIGTAANQLPIICLDFAIPSINPETLKLCYGFRINGGLVLAAIAEQLINKSCSLYLACYLCRRR